MTDESFYLSTTEIARSIRSREISPVEIVQAHLDRIMAVNHKLNAVVTMTDDALDRAREAETAVTSGEALGPLHGVPFTAKDTFDTAGVRTTIGSLLYKDNVPALDSTIVNRLKQAGAILVGKTNVPEFALDGQTNNRVFGRTNNPWNLEHTTSGSSGGAAAALATGMTPFEIGSDVGGSIRIPASYCNVVGFKPTHGRVPLTGHNPAAIQRYMHTGPMSRTVRDNALILNIIAGADGYDPFASNIPVPDMFDLDLPLPKLRIGFSPEDGYAPVAQEVQAVVAKAAAVLGEQGCTVEEVKLPWLKKHDYMIEGLEIMLVEAVHYAGPIVKGRESELAENMNRVLGWELPDFDRYLTFEHNHVNQLRHDVASFFRDYDVLIGPTSPMPPPRHVEKDGTWNETTIDVDGKPAPWYHGSVNSQNWDLTGSPAISVPFGWSNDGLPIGVQLIGRHFDETILLRVAAALERATDASLRRPSV